MTRRKLGVKRAPYKRRFHQPLFTTSSKTTTPQGYKEYMRQYMKQLRLMEKKLKDANK